MSMHFFSEADIENARESGYFGGLIRGGVLGGVIGSIVTSLLWAFGF